MAQPLAFVTPLRIIAGMIPFGKAPGGEDTHCFTLQAGPGSRVDLSDYGATLVRWFAPDRRGNSEDVVLGFDSVAGYVDHRSYFGATVGRYGNRIAQGRFSLDGKIHVLATNNHPGGMPCHLHGGRAGFDKRLWAADPHVVGGRPAMRFRLRSPDGDEGYPGNLDVSVTYSLGGDSDLRIDYEAATDRATPINLTNHSYFNLAGEGHESVLGHIATVQASQYLPVNAGMIPTGELASVDHTPFDFRAPARIGDRIEHPNEQLRRGGGYDHTFVLQEHTTPEPALAATVFEPLSGRLLEVFTTEPGVQFYTGNFLDGTSVGKGGRPYPRRSGFCLETQHFPDSPNQPGFPSVILRPGMTFRSSTIYQLGSR